MCVAKGIDIHGGVLSSHRRFRANSSVPPKFKRLRHHCTGIG
ncbi:hypothetical protein Ga0080574_TMP4464 [Salipiger abyssi]|uniref:Uncharacterized protein n=1 Tax=Salipiger abyssi TaxID=1250539 RepID=A0A1P8UZJ9_9RHOB|nr:hypothetical protein Ga0080574_TMP4464 [Salipiger abyssi]